MNRTLPPLAFAAALLASASTSALAAVQDRILYGAPELAVRTESAPEPAQAEALPRRIGHGWYLRGEINTDHEFEFNPVVGVGAGYRFNRVLRLEGVVSYWRESIVGFDVDADAFRLMANVYADLVTVNGVTPYVGAGAGSIQFGVSVDNLSEKAWVSNYALMAGLSFSVSDRAEFDIGYQYNRVNDAFDIHEIKVGFRYNLF